MNAQEILDREDFKKCAEFHGHICPGLSIGYKAAKTAMEKLAKIRATDEEIVAIVETDACSADAVQVLTGCTFGKGNFIYRDYGKMVLTLLSRETGQGVRVAMRPDVFPTNEQHFSLLQKVIKGEASPEEKEAFYALHFQRSKEVLETPVESLFTVETMQMELPAKAKVEPSQPCARCGEPTMPSKMETVDEKMVCRGCLN